MKKIFLLVLCVLPLLGCIQKAVELMRETPPALERVPLLKDAEAGNMEAQYNLGKNYCCGTGTLEDNGQALYWWCQAGRQGQPDALFEIGNLFLNTHGIVGTQIPVDPARAYAFYQLAENCYHKDAAAERRALEKTLTVQQRRDADELIRNWPDAPCELPSTLQPKPDPTLMIHDAKRRSTI